MVRVRVSMSTNPGISDRAIMPPTLKRPMGTLPRPMVAPTRMTSPTTEDELQWAYEDDPREIDIEEEVIAWYSSKNIDAQTCPPGG